MNHRRLDILGSPVFVISLFLLVMNDWYLKQAFHNELTGKLSDISGLTLCFLLFYSLYPGYPKIIFAILNAGFVYWKSPASQWFIDLWNSLEIATIARAIDYTDLLALPVVILAWIYADTRKVRPVGRMYQNLVIISSVFAIAGTSMPPTKEEMILINKIEEVRKERVSNYTYSQDSLDENILNKLEPLLSTIPDPDKLRKQGIEVELWENSKFDAITYNFDTFYINTWVFHGHADRVTEYNISPRKRCDRQLALEENSDINPFLGAYLRFYRKENMVQLDELELVLCDLPGRKSDKEALNYFIKNYIEKIENSFLKD